MPASGPAHRLLPRRALAADVGIVAGSHARVDHANLAVEHCADALSDGLPELGGLGDRADALGPLSHREHGEVDVRLVDPLADPLVLDRPAPHAGDALLVRLVVVERAIVADDQETGNLVMRGRPQRRDAHQVVAVAHETDGNAARALERQRGSHRDAGPRSDAASAVAAEVVERMREVAGFTPPAQRGPPGGDGPPPRAPLWGPRGPPEGQHNPGAAPRPSR